MPAVNEQCSHGLKMMVYFSRDEFARGRDRWMKNKRYVAAWLRACVHQYGVSDARPTEFNELKSISIKPIFVFRAVGEKSICVLYLEQRLWEKRDESENRILYTGCFHNDYPLETTNDQKRNAQITGPNSRSPTRRDTCSYLRRSEAIGSSPRSEESASRATEGYT